MSTHVISVTHKNNFSKAMEYIKEIEFYSPQCSIDPPGISFMEDSLKEYQDLWTTGLSPTKHATLYSSLLKHCDNLDENDLEDLKFYVCMLESVGEVSFEDFRDKVKDFGKNAIIFINEFDYDDNLE